MIKGGLKMAWTCKREEAMDILRGHVKAEHLIRHALTVEAVMRYFAEIYGEDVEKWSIIGLLHDIDFEQYPEQHCHKVRELLSPHGFPEEYLHAIESHGFGLVSDVEPIERMEKVLFATDELTGADRRDGADASQPQHTRSGIELR
jgi:putative nucleotidyltransferase with HDIG domain